MSNSIDRRDFIKLTSAAGFGLGILSGSESLEKKHISGNEALPTKSVKNKPENGILPDGPYSKKQQWMAKDLWPESISSNLNLEKGTIVLDDQMLIENDAAGIGAIQKDVWEEVSSDVILRKSLTIERWPVQEAIITMLVYPVQPQEPNSGGKLSFNVNGKGPIVYEVHHFWTSVHVPIEYLKKGENVIEVTSYGEDTVFRTPLALYSDFQYGSSSDINRTFSSQRSKDESQNWTSKGLGASNAEQGEYPIRLKIRAYHKEGYLQTPILNLADSNTKNVFHFPVEIESASYNLNANSGADRKITVYMRSGDTHKPEAGGWQEWQRLESSNITDKLKGRFIQLKIVFHSNAGDASPVLRGFRLNSQCVPLNLNLQNQFFVTEAVNKPITYSSFDFYQERPSDPELQGFRKQYKLDKIVQGAKTEIEKILLLRNWVSSQWEWFMPDPKYGPMTHWDARQILKPQSKKIGGNCLNYSIVFAQACQSFGIPARMVNMNYSVWGGHELPEIWSRDYEKWILMDPQFDTMFIQRETGIPLSVLEVHRAFLGAYYPGDEVIDRDTWTIADRNRRAEAVEPEDIPVRMQIGGHALAGRLDDYVWWQVTENPPAPGYQGGYGFTSTAYFRWLPRSNWMSQPYPMPVNHGRTHWGWDGYLAWTDQQTPETPEHRHFVRREADMYGRLCTVDFSVRPEKEGVLKINLATKTPGFKYFELIDNGKQKLISDSTYNWDLGLGLNKLKLKSVDTQGNRGSVSKLAVSYIPKDRS